MPHEIVFDLSKSHLMEMPSRLTVRGGEIFETEVVGPVEFVAATDVTYGTGASVTTVSRTIPAETEEGDLIIACLMQRSGANNITEPDGFSRIAQQITETTEFSVSQWGEVWTKTAEAADADTSISFTASSAGRMALILVVLRHEDGVVLEDSESDVYTSSVQPGIEIVPSAASLGEGRILLGFVTCIAGDTNNRQYTFPEGWTQHTPTTVPSSPTHELNRMCVATRSQEEGASPTADVEHGPAQHDAGMIALIFAPA